MEAIPAAQAHSKGVGHVVPGASTGRGFSLHAPSWDEFDHARLHVDFQSAELQIPILFHNDFTESGVGCTPVVRSTCGLVAMASASQAECQQFDPGQVYVLLLPRGDVKCTSPKEAHLQSYGKKRHTLLIGAQMENNKGQERLSKTTKGRRGCRKQQRAGEAGEKDKGQERLSKTTKDKRGGRKRQRVGEAVGNNKGQEKLLKTRKGRRVCRKRQRAGEAVENDKGSERLFKTT